MSNRLLTGSVLAFGGLASLVMGADSIFAGENQNSSATTQAGQSKDIDHSRFYANIKRYEGVSYVAYKDPRGIKTIGAGFNLQKSGARERIQELGLDYDKVFNEEVRITDEQVTSLLKKDADIAIQDAKKYLGNKVWEVLDVRAKETIADIAYVRGYPNLIKFKGVKRALSKVVDGKIIPDYLRAADELEWENPDAEPDKRVHTKWYNRTGRRAKEEVALMRKIGRGE